VDRAAQILKILAASDVSLGVSELGRQLGLNKSTVHDIVTTLSRHSLVERDDTTKTYRLGHALAVLGQRAGARANLQTLAHPRLVEFARSVEETVLLGTYHDGHVTIIDREEAPHELKITSPIGHRLYYSVGAFGKIFLSAMTEAQVTELLRDYPPRPFTFARSRESHPTEQRLNAAPLDMHSMTKNICRACAAAAPVVDSADT
jgi:IclR family acetate operon transcriptional repressor